MSASEEPARQLPEPSPVDEPSTVVDAARRGSRLPQRLRNGPRTAPVALALAALGVAGAVVFLLTAGGNGEDSGQVRASDTSVGRTTPRDPGQQSSVTARAEEGTGGATAPGGGVTAGGGVGGVPSGGGPSVASGGGRGTQPGGGMPSGTPGAGQTGSEAQGGPGTAAGPVGGGTGGTGGGPGGPAGGTGDTATGTTVPAGEPTDETAGTTGPGSGESVPLPGEYEQICSLVRLAGGGPAPAGSELYHPALDPDGDGLACE